MLELTVNICPVNVREYNRLLMGGKTKTIKT